jgi:DNA mismatch repair protein MutS2
MSGQNRLEVLHGKGTGALKKIVSEILKEHPSVKDFYFAPIEAGGDGITIVELK